MHMNPRLLLKKLVLLVGGLLLLAGCSLLNHLDKVPPLDPAQWPNFSGEWDFDFIVEPSSLRGLKLNNVPICQKGPELWSAWGDAHLRGLVRLDGTFELLADFFVPGISIKWIIWGNLKDDQFEGYYKPIETESFFKVRYLGHRLGSVPPQGCIEGFRGEAAAQLPQTYPSLSTLSSLTGAAQPLAPSQWPVMAGEWQFSVVDPLALKGRKFSIPICQLGPQLSSAFVEDFMAGLVHLDGKFALIVHQYVGPKRSVWTLWGDLTKTEFEGYYKPWNSDAFYAVTLQGRRLGPVPQGVNCPSGFQRSP